MKRRDFLLSTAAAGAVSTGGGPQAVAQGTHGTSTRQSQNYFEFSEDGRECVIKRADTPIPWMNLLTNDDFQTWITHRGQTECFLLDRGLGGLTNPQEVSGWIYLRDRASGGYFAVNEPAAGGKWQSAHGLGYTRLQAEALEVACSITYFVPRDDTALVWIVSVKNKQARAREFDIFTSVEWNLGDQNKAMVLRGHGGGGDAYTGGSQFNMYKKIYLENGALYAEQKVWRTLGMTAGPWPYTGYLASSAPVESYDCVKTTFLGRDRTLRNPEAVERGHCANQAFWSLNEFPWGALHNQIRLKSHGEEQVVFVLGAVRNKSKAKEVAHRYFQHADAELERVRSYWQGFVESTTHVETPEKEIDRDINIWLKYQWRTNIMRSQNNGLRGLGFWSYGLFYGHIGWAVREVSVQPHDAGLSKEALTAYMQGQYRDYTKRMFSESQPLMLRSDLDTPWPPATPANAGLTLPHSHEADNAYAFCLYFQETGDLSFLEERVRFVDGGEDTVFRHMANCVDNSLLGLTARGLPLLNKGIGDWNDELNMISRNGKGESIMFAMTICFTLRECAGIARAAGKTKEADSWMESYARIKQAINDLAWDGEWYLRAFADGGADERIPIGISKDSEGRIYLNTQTWAVLSGVAEGERLKQCMASVDRHLVSKYGPLIYGPSYSHLDLNVGVASTYAPGWRNGCVYLRPAGWAIIAACVADMPELAFKMYERSALSRVRQNIERFQHEPYVYPENYVGPEHPLAGMGQYQWCLGEGANWMWHSYVSYILGVRATLPGLLIDPKIPAGWKRFKAKRTFRGATYEIEVANPNGATMGVRSMSIDGREVAGNLIRPHSDGRTHSVRVSLGG